MLRWKKFGRILKNDFGFRLHLVTEIRSLVEQSRNPLIKQKMLSKRGRRQHFLVYSKLPHHLHQHFGNNSIALVGRMQAVVSHID